MSNKITLTKIAELSGILGLILAIIFGINQWNSSSNESENLVFETDNEIHSQKELVNFIEAYFDMLMRRDFSETDLYFNYPVQRFYDLTHANSSDIKNQLKTYNSEWKYQRINLDQETLKVVKMEDDKMRVQFMIDYQTKRNTEDKFKDFRLKIIMLLDKNGKLNSIYEMKK